MEVYCFPIYLSSHHHIYIFKSLCASRDDYFENPGETNVLACKIFTSGCCPWLKNVACLSSPLLNAEHRKLSGIINHLEGLFSKACKTNSKEITLTNHNRRKQSDEPIGIPSKLLQLAQSMVKNMLTRCNWILALLLVG